MNQQYTTDGNSDIYCNMFGLQCEISGCLGLFPVLLLLSVCIHSQSAGQQSVLGDLP